jgi:hypothetical protein
MDKEPAKAEDYTIKLHDACSSETGASLPIEVGETDDQIVDRLKGYVGY